MTKLPQGLSLSDTTYLFDLDVAALNPSAPPERLRDIASRYIKWGLHTPNVKTGLLGVVQTAEGYEVFIRCLLLNVQWTIVKEACKTKEEALSCWYGHASELGCPARIIDKQFHLAAARECSVNP